MKLVKLSANKPGFKTVNFNPVGPTFVLGKEKAPNAKEKGKTYNAVGKSLIVQLVHFCLGASSIEEFGKKIPGWEFSLEFEIAGDRYIVTRKTSEQGVILLNGDSMNPKKLTSTLGAVVFPAEASPQLSFRSLISRFIRRSKESYNQAEIYLSKEKDFHRLLNNAYLLGLDTSLIKKKHEIKEEKDRVRELKQNFENDSILAEFYTGDRDIDIELRDLEEEIESLDRNLKGWAVADDFHKIEIEANALAVKIKNLENRGIGILNAVSSIEKSLKVRPDIPRELVVRVYEEAKFKFGEQVVRELDDVLNFHTSLLANREKRLRLEKERLETSLVEIEKERKAAGLSLDGNLKYLDTHRALDEVISLTNKQGDLKARLHKLRDFKELVKQYDLKYQELQMAMTKENIEAQKYLDSEEALISKNLDLFRSYCKEFYSDKPSGITVTNNEGDNQIRFNISSKIQDDASDGVNEVKIFCFDLTLLTGHHGHKVQFLFHDSRLFSDMDPRQRETLFRLAHRTSTSQGFQYIATVNEDQFLSFKDRMTPEDYKKIIEDNIRLELTDASPESKLLGIEIDMDYE